MSASSGCEPKVSCNEKVVKLIEKIIFYCLLFKFYNYFVRKSFDLNASTCLKWFQNYNSGGWEGNVLPLIKSWMCHCSNFSLNFFLIYYTYSANRVGYWLFIFLEDLCAFAPSTGPTLPCQASYIFYSDESLGKHKD